VSAVRGRPAEATRLRLPLQPPAVPGPDVFLVGALALGWAALVGLALAYVSVPAAVVLAAAPLAGLGAVALLDSDRAVLFLAAFGLTLILPAVNGPLPLTGSVNVFAADFVVIAAVAAWLSGRLLRGLPLTRPWAHKTPVLGPALLLFGAVTFAAALRGNEEYGASLVGQPMRLVAYAAIAAAIVDIDARKAWKGLTAVFYAGAVWQALNGIYFIATGTSQTDAADLSTGGTRYLALDVSLYVAAALFLALLNIRYDSVGRRRFLHVAIVLIATFDVLIAFGRGVYIAVAVLSFVLIVAYREIRRTLFRALPVLAPFIVVAVLFVPPEVREVAPTFVDRVTPELGYDASVRWREEANKAILKQFHESPVTGVGFGRGASFTLNNEEWVIDQDPHNSYIYLLAGGGLLLLSSFLLLVLCYAFDTRRRLRSAERPEERVLVVFSVVVLLTFLINAAVEPLFTYPSVLLTMWALLLLPTVVPLRPRRKAPAAARSAPSPSFE
jgi:O-antigen ligase